MIKPPGNTGLLALPASTNTMKKQTLALFALAGLAALPSCKKAKFDDEPYLKYTVNGTAYEYDNEVIYAGIDDADGTQVWSISKGCPACENSFFLQSKTDVALDTPHPMVGIINYEDADLYLGNVHYDLYNGVVQLSHLDVGAGINTYMEGTFRLTLINENDHTDTLQVTDGSFFHNNY